MPDFLENLQQGKRGSLVRRARCGLCLYRQGSKKIASKGEKRQRNKTGMVKEVFKRLILPQHIPLNPI